MEVGLGEQACYCTAVYCISITVSRGGLDDACSGCQEGGISPSPSGVIREDRRWRYYIIIESMNVETLGVSASVHPHATVPLRYRICHYRLQQDYIQSEECGLWLVIQITVSYTIKNTTALSDSAVSSPFSDLTCTVIVILLENGGPFLLLRSHARVNLRR